MINIIGYTESGRLIGLYEGGGADTFWADDLFEAEQLGTKIVWWIAPVW